MDKDYSITEVKICTKCKVAKSPDCFKRDRQQSSGLYPSCKECVTAYRKAYNERKKLGLPPIIRVKQTKEEKKEYHRQWNIDNAERIKETKRKYRAENKDRINAYRREWSKQEHVKEYAKAYSIRTTDRRRAYYREHYKNNPEQYAKRCNKRRARLHNATIGDDIPTTAEFLVEQNHRCNHCHRIEEEIEGYVLYSKVVKWHLDHIVPLIAGGSHTRSNLQVLCAECNWSKAAQ